MPPITTAGQPPENPAPAGTAAPNAALLDELFREEVRRARAMPPEEKLLAGERLFEWACEITLVGIRGQFPQASETQRQQILAQRLALRRKLEAVP